MKKTIHQLVHLPDEEVDSMSKEEANEYLQAYVEINDNALRIYNQYQSANPEINGINPMLKKMEYDRKHANDYGISGPAHRFFYSAPGPSGFVLLNKPLPPDRQDDAAFYLEYHTLNEQLTHKGMILENRLSLLRMEEASVRLGN